MADSSIATSAPYRNSQQRRASVKSEGTATYAEIARDPQRECVRVDERECVRVSETHKQRSAALEGTGKVSTSHTPVLRQMVLLESVFPANSTPSCPSSSLPTTVSVSCNIDDFRSIEPTLFTRATNSGTLLSGKCCRRPVRNKTGAGNLWCAFEEFPRHLPLQLAD